MASAWVSPRATKQGKRFRVLYRLGGRESVPRYGGSFVTQREALARKAWIAGEPRRCAFLICALPRERRGQRSLAERWQASRVDVSAGTMQTYRVALGRLLPRLGDQAGRLGSTRRPWPISSPNSTPPA